MLESCVVTSGATLVGEDQVWRCSNAWRDGRLALSVRTTECSYLLILFLMMLVGSSSRRKYRGKKVARGGEGRRRETGSVDPQVAAEDSCCQSLKSAKTARPQVSGPAARPRKYRERRTQKESSER